MQDNQANYILPKYLREGINLTQIYHMHLGDLNSLLQHWMQRQDAGEISFCFKKVDCQGKQASAVENTPIGVGPRAELELDPQDVCEDQGCERVSRGNGDSGSSVKEGPDQQAQDTNSIRFLQLSWSWNMLTSFGIIQAPKTSLH